MGSKIGLWFQFFPLTAFVAVAKSGEFTPEAWRSAFIVGGILAVTETLFLIRRHSMLDRLLLGANLYLVVGGLAALLGIDSLLQLYSRLQASAIFILILLIGLFTTFFGEAGFVGMPNGSKLEDKRSSFILLAFTAVCAAFSFHWRGNTTLSGALPIVALVVAKKLLISLGRSSIGRA